MFADRWLFGLKGVWRVLFACGLSGVLAACTLTDPNAVSPRGDYAIDTYYPPGDAIATAQQRAREWWQRHQQRFGAQPPYLAVQTNLLLQGDVTASMEQKLFRANTASLFFAQNSFRRTPIFTIYGVVIFDVRTGRVVSPQGYAVVDTPARGRVAQFGPYIARYIGTGK